MVKTFVGRALIATAASVVLLGAVAPGSASAAAAGPAEDGGGASVVTPTLRLFDFGATVGFPLLCQLGGAGVLAFTGQAGAAESFTPFVTETNTQCQTFSNQGHDYLVQGIQSSQQLSPINPVVDPGIDALATGAQTLGEDYGPAIAPLGPTVAGFARTLAFFKGS